MSRRPSGEPTQAIQSNGTTHPAPAASARKASAAALYSNQGTWMTPSGSGSEVTQWPMSKSGAANTAAQRASASRRSRSVIVIGRLRLWEAL